ncbi:MAG: outer membrane lipoprotein-sorting protein [Chlorobi bacterium]|nr:outer membrane lipoprotein-sorting protein [Chlorobiota bacterium]
MIKIRNKNVAVVSIFLMMAVSPLVCGQPTAKTIMRKSREVSRFKGMESVTELHILNNRGGERIRKIAMASLSQPGVEKRIIRFLEPADVKGTGLLIFDYENKNDDMWMYLPALRKVRRIVSSEKGKSFMGSEFSNADMSAPNLDDFTLTLKGEQSVDGMECFVIDMIPVSHELIITYGFARKEVYIGKSDYMLREAHYYDKNGTLVKVLHAKDIQPVSGSGGKSMARWLSMENKINNRTSWLRILQVRYNPDVNASMFTTAYLQKQ